MEQTCWKIKNKKSTKIEPLCQDLELCINNIITLIFPPLGFNHIHLFVEALSLIYILLHLGTN